ncbi:ATP-dependent DNA helicase RecQ family protein [Tieghemostelium lacteum]|uniref:DNA 3'-5' helicase n=1 Tax=Tieghemostelium lacteum TaxID=361077 RepID=A0A152A3C8_TIELA|nr:ATP-dependent DNA helicase RecQ family protein [Tieghemostelium lacteum]|eukprot:KYR00704.1 ATP-dependent DNA helicase RecQ family protein [Tieghemostelium lacteum]
MSTEIENNYKSNLERFQQSKLTPFGLDEIVYNTYKPTKTFQIENNLNHKPYKSIDNLFNISYKLPPTTTSQSNTSSSTYIPASTYTNSKKSPDYNNKTTFSNNKSTSPKNTPMSDNMADNFTLSDNEISPPPQRSNSSNGINSFSSNNNKSSNYISSNPPQYTRSTLSTDSSTTSSSRNSLHEEINSIKIKLFDLDRLKKKLKKEDTQSEEDALRNFREKKATIQEIEQLTSQLQALEKSLESGGSNHQPSSSNFTSNAYSSSTFSTSGNTSFISSNNNSSRNTNSTLSTTKSFNTPNSAPKRFDDDMIFENDGNDKEDIPEPITSNYKSVNGTKSNSTSNTNSYRTHEDSEIITNDVPYIFNDSDESNGGVIDIDQEDLFFEEPKTTTTSTKTSSFSTSTSTSFSTLTKSNSNIQFTPTVTDTSKFGGNNFPWYEQIEICNKTMFGNKSWRLNQKEIINAALDGNDVFVLMPTGGGKSLCYQIPAYCQEGLTIVISPLISLIQDQVQFLQSIDYPAAALSSSVSSDEVSRIYKDLNRHDGPQIKLLYLTPEKVAQSDTIMNIFRTLHSKGRFSRVVIDESHCISSWGHDFRPDYKSLGTLKKNFPDLPIMALTATATERVKSDVIYNLGMKNPVCFKQSFNRPNLSYFVLPKKKETVQNIVTFINKNYPGKSGIIYCFSCYECETVAANLKSLGISAQYYHGKMDTNDRATVQEKWTRDRVKVICATIAFGMGINKPDVRFVIHYTLPKSLEGYYQESGRAGRDGLPSHCLLYYNYADKHKIDDMIQNSAQELGTTMNIRENRESLNKMVSYCENRIDCRRVLQLSHFNENFDKNQCNQTCDNCQCTDTFTNKDVTEEAKNIIYIVNNTENMTVNMIIDVVKGSKNKKIIQKGQDKLKYYGFGKSMDKLDIERIIRELVSRNILKEHIQPTSYKPICYIVLGNKMNQFTSGQMKLVLSFRSSTSANNASKKKSTSSLSDSGSSSIVNMPNIVPIAKNTSLSKEELLSALHDCRAEIADENNIIPYHIATENALNDLADKKPQTLEELRGISTFTKIKIEKYGQQFIDCIKNFLNPSSSKSTKKSSSSSSTKKPSILEDDEDFKMDTTATSTIDLDDNYQFDVEEEDIPTSVMPLTSSHYFNKNSNNNKRKLDDPDENPKPIKQTKSKSTK